MDYLLSEIKDNNYSTYKVRTAYNIFELHDFC